MLPVPFVPDLVIDGNMNDINDEDSEDKFDNNRTSMELTTSYYLKHDIIISSPQRILDKIHMIYVIIKLLY